MKMILVSVLALFVSAQAFAAPTTVFHCTSTLKMGENQSMTLGMTVVQNGSQLTSYFIGAADNGPAATVKQTVLPRKMNDVGGLKEILAATSMSQAEFKNVAQIVVYTTGNFEDDAAGVRAAQFVDKKGATLASGMFFGWGGALNCQ